MPISARHACACLSTLVCSPTLCSPHASPPSNLPSAAGLLWLLGSHQQWQPWPSPSQAWPRRSSGRLGLEGPELEQKVRGGGGGRLSGETGDGSRHRHGRQRMGWNSCRVSPIPWFSDTPCGYMLLLPNEPFPPGADNGSALDSALSQGPKPELNHCLSWANSQIQDKSSPYPEWEKNPHLGVM